MNYFILMLIVISWVPHETILWMRKLRLKLFAEPDGKEVRGPVAADSQ